MTGTAPVIWWVRRDLRLSDNPALRAAAAGGPVIAAFINDESVARLGAAPKWRLGQGLAELAASLETRGSRLVLRSGAARDELARLVAETGAAGVVWNRLYDPAARERDAQIKRDLAACGVSTQSFAGHLLFEPWAVRTGQGGHYSVFTPYWRAVRTREVPPPDRAPSHIPAPARWPESESLADWRMGAAMGRGARVVARHARIGEAAAQGRLEAFIAHGIDAYDRMRDLPAAGGTSRLSENLAWGEIGPRTVWHAALRGRDEGRAGAESFLRQLVWRDFAWHLLYHTPRLADANWRAEWDAFPWRGDNEEALLWRQGRTGVPMVDAAMREMYVTGTMHNRARMVAASFLTKHLLTHWKVGMDWFADCLIDWDPAANALGWQWVAGSGPDAAPYFRIFNPETQAERFDPEAAYRHRFVAELTPDPGRDARDFFRAAPRGWGLDPAAPYPDPVIGLKAGRARALDAFQKLGR
jgi:deoxyribodipyrimidine photo-lyase